MAYYHKTRNTGTPNEQRTTEHLNTEQRNAKHQRKSRNNGGIPE